MGRQAQGRECDAHGERAPPCHSTRRRTRRSCARPCARAYSLYSRDDELRLDDAQAEALVAYAKATLKQRWAPKPIPHKLRGVWADLPAGTWLLPNA